MQTYGDWNYEPAAFVMPEDTTKDSDYQAVIKQQEEKIKELAENIKYISLPALAGFHI